MAKEAKETKGRPRKATTTLNGWAFRATEEWFGWLGELSDHVARDKVDTVEEALRRFAKAEGFRSPPKRTGS